MATCKKAFGYQSGYPNRAPGGHLSRSDWQHSKPGHLWNRQGCPLWFHGGATSVFAGL